MNEAQLRGIDLKQLRKESPTHPDQVRIRRAHEERARLYWRWTKEIARPKPTDKHSRKEPKFTPEQLRIIEEIIERKKNSWK